MFAIVRLNTFDLDRLANARQDVEEFDALHASQPGYVGSLVVDLQSGRRLVINVWQSKEHSEAALGTLAPQVGRLSTHSRPLHPSSSAPEPSSPLTCRRCESPKTGKTGRPGRKRGPPPTQVSYAESRPPIASVSIMVARKECLRGRTSRALRAARRCRSVDRGLGASG